MESTAALIPLIVRILAFASLLLTLLLGVVLAFHWFRYAMNAGVSILALVVYSVVSVSLLSSMLAALAFFNGLV